MDHLFRINSLAISLVLLVMLSGDLQGQSPVHSYYQESLNVNTKGMAVLGGWALTNIAVGAIGWNRQTGQRMYFHQMNLFWNGVNLSIAALALYGNLSADFGSWSHDLMLEKQLRTQRIFLINGGLDILYMGTGLVLTKVASRYPKQEARLAGYGNSVMIQGGFLFLFDLVMYGIQRANRMDFLEGVNLTGMQEAIGLSIQITLQ